ncbi:hypothetical protein [Salinisphaera sp. Q1T1-3]|uniref:RIFT barrel domain-containing protein n=1 Tax=Salinisphaera sp. Q1T1-3 TaxID=2321229 RepID=UPI000EC02AE4|nr:hypothetical protein [Salinisphaera sp. Q1T1-3]RJS94707.1 hypothetical protein D3260_02720 [Salinisphaera sp. Q1T1-3]
MSALMTRFLVIVLLGFGLVACNDGGGSDQSGSSADTSGGGASQGGDGTTTDGGTSGKGDTASALSAEAGTPITDAFPSARRITTAKVVSTGGRAAATLTFGQVFAKGQVAGDAHLVAVRDGRVLATQTDPKATWADGSLRHAVLSVAVPRTGGDAAVSLSLYAVDRAPQWRVKAPTLSDLLSRDFDARLALTMSGTRYTANARTAIESIQSRGRCPVWGARDCKRWLDGPLVSEWIVAAPLDDGRDQAPLLRTYFHVRAIRGPAGRIDNVRVDTVVENTRSYDISPSNQHYDARITVGQSQYSVSDLTHYLHARWHHVLWHNGAPKRRILPSVAYLQQSRAISNYADLSPDSDFLAGVRQSNPPMARGDLTAYMGQTGAQAGIGPLPQWTSAYAVSGALRAFRWMKANDDAGGSYGFHYRDAATGRALSIVDHPYVTLANYNWASRAGGRFAVDLLPRCNADCESPWSYEIAHQPSIGYVTYLVTGDYYYLEEMQFQASYDELWANEGYRSFDKGLLLGAQDQVRGQAWVLRAISDTAFATPDDDPMKSYFVGLIDNIVADYLDKYVDAPNHPLHVLDAYGAVHYQLNGQRHNGIAPWQQDFFTWAVGHAAEQDVPGASRLLAWFAPWYVGLMTDTATLGGDGFCWLKASAYAMQLRDDANSPIYDSLQTVYDRSFPALAGTSCNSQTMRRAMADGGTPVPLDQMDGYPESPTGFPSNLQIGLAMIANTGESGVRQAWQRFATRATQPDYANMPQFAVVPRSAN